jgi:hypothetical protein
MNDLERIWFIEYMRSLAEIYPNPKLTDKKISIYFDFFNKRGFNKMQYEYSRNEIYRNKRDINFPSMAEIIDNIKDMFKIIREE